MEFFHDLLGLIGQINDTIVDAAASPWVYLILLGLCIIDGFFPPLPSESVVIALAATAAASGVPNVWLVVVVAAVGAVIGDNIAYSIGQAVGTTRFSWMRRPKVSAAFRWAQASLGRRAALLIMVARYIPVGRVAVNMTAGAVGLPRLRFFWLTVIAGTSWAVYSVGIGVLAGQWVEHNPLLGITIALVTAALIGLIADRLTRRFADRRRARPRGTR